MGERIRAVVLYGGRSTEHEVSCRSAAFVVRNLRAEKYDILPVGIDKDGSWWVQDPQKLLAHGGDQLPILRDKGLGEAAAAVLGLFAPSLEGTPKGVERSVVFPVLHGTYGEDGCIQGLLDMQEIAYVGADRISSAIGMDKVFAKRLVEAAGIAVVPYTVVRKDEWPARSAKVCREIELNLKYPLFVKPASLGSSVGISKVRRPADLAAAIDAAFRVDEKILVESGLTVREIEFGALGGYEPEISAAGEVESPEGFYSYDEKYSSASKTSVIVPAALAAAKQTEGQALAREIFMALGLHGMARIDLFLERGTDKYYFNEVNTLPGFTSISQYPLLWKHAGLSAQQLVDRLIGLALERGAARRSLLRSFG